MRESPGYQCPYPPPHTHTHIHTHKHNHAQRPSSLPTHNYVTVVYSLAIGALELFLSKIPRQVKKMIMIFEAMMECVRECVSE